MKLFSFDFAPCDGFAQGAKTGSLCTSCEASASFVDGVGKNMDFLLHKPSTPLKSPRFGQGRCEIGFPCGFSQLTFPTEGGKYERSGFPTQPVGISPSRYRLGTNETCQESFMNKADLVDKIAGACEVSKAQATTAIDTAVDSITSALRKGDRVALIGFGTFSVSQRKARNGRNPQTGATIKIAARRVAKFTPGAELKKAVNKK
jgi:DNA-binding protein HU-beta